MLTILILIGVYLLVKNFGNQYQRQREAKHQDSMFRRRRTRK